MRRPGYLDNTRYWFNPNSGRLIDIRHLYSPHLKFVFTDRVRGKSGEELKAKIAREAATINLRVVPVWESYPQKEPLDLSRYL